VLTLQEDPWLPPPHRSHGRLGGGMLTPQKGLLLVRVSRGGPKGRSPPVRADNCPAHLTMSRFSLWSGCVNRCTGQ
jgi:hypothetical protein